VVLAETSLEGILGEAWEVELVVDVGEELCEELTDSFISFRRSLRIDCPSAVTNVVTSVTPRDWGWVGTIIGTGCKIAFSKSFSFAGGAGVGSFAFATSAFGFSDCFGLSFVITAGSPVCGFLTGLTKACIAEERSFRLSAIGFSSTFGADLSAESSSINFLTVKMSSTEAAFSSLPL